MMHSKQNMIFVLLGLFLIMACGPEPIWLRPALDTPSRHVSNGHQLLERGKLNDAHREFMRAKELDPRYVEAHVGLGLIWGYKGDFEKGMAAMDEAQALASGEDDRAAVEKGVRQLKAMQANASSSQ